MGTPTFCKQKSNTYAMLLMTPQIKTHKIVQKKRQRVGMNVVQHYFILLFQTPRKISVTLCRRIQSINQEKH